MISEQMIIHYVSSFKKALSNDNSAAEGVQDDASVRVEAKDQLMQNIPDVLYNLVGQQAAKTGTSKVFETVQNKTLNKQLVYDVVESFAKELFPELRSHLHTG